MTLPDDPDTTTQLDGEAGEDATAAGGQDDPRLTPPGPPRKMLSPLFWVMIVVGLVCVLAGLAIALVGPRLYPHSEPPIAVVPR